MPHWSNNFASSTTTCSDSTPPNACGANGGEHNKMDHCTRDVEELWLLSEEDPEDLLNLKRGSLRPCFCVRWPVVGTCLALNSLSLSSQWRTGCHKNPETHHVKSMSHSLTIIQRFQNSLSRQLNRNDFSLVGQGAGKSTSAAMACINCHFGCRVAHTERTMWLLGDIWTPFFAHRSSTHLKSTIAVRAVLNNTTMAAAPM